MAMHDEAAESTLDTIWQLIDSALAAALVEVLLYGMQVIIFCICAYFLLQKKSRAGAIILLALSIMLVIATVDVAMTFRVMLHYLQAVLRLEMSSDYLLADLGLKNTFFVTDNLIADALLLLRCYMVWQGHKYDSIIAFIAAAFLIACTICGYLATEITKLDIPPIIAPLYLWSVFGFNIVMTIATAGRIWWLSRVSLPTLDRQSTRSYNITVAILIQSGALYALSIMLLLIFWQKPSRMILFTIVYRFVGIIPALMIVQVELWGRGRQTGLKGTTNTTNPMFTTVVVDAISTQLFAQGLDPDTEDLRTNNNIQTDPRTPYPRGKRDSAEINVQ